MTTEQRFQMAQIAAIFIQAEQMASMIGICDAEFQAWYDVNINSVYLWTIGTGADCDGCNSGHISKFDNTIEALESADSANEWSDFNNGNTPEIPAESLAELKEWQKEHPEFEAVLISEEKTAEEIHDELHAILNGTEKDLDEKYKKNPFSHPIFDTIEKFKNNDSERLFTAAVAAMQGMIVSDISFSSIPNLAWDYAEALINEGKKRNLL